MNGWLGKITGSSVARPRSSQSGQVRLLQVQTGPSVQTIQLVPQAGEDYNPPDGALALCVQSGGRWFAIATFDGVEPTAAKGERLLYSVDANLAVKASIHLKADGSIAVTTASGKALEINGNSKTFVTHAELNTALQSFITALNLHVHPTAALGPPSPPTSPMSLNISSAATTTVKTGG
jgi:hypothetical protein